MPLSYEAIQILKDQLIEMEGYRQLPYRDSEGFLTIGIGRNLQQVGIDLDEAEFLLVNDINHAVKQLEKLDWFNALNEMRQIVIVNMCFNLGYAKLLQFKNMIQALKDKDYNKAAQEMLSSLWARQVPNRAQKLSEIMIQSND